MGDFSNIINENTINRHFIQQMLKIVANLIILYRQMYCVVAEAYTTRPNSKASSRVLYNIFESTCGG
jgi:hypothetical protein